MCFDWKDRDYHFKSFVMDVMCRTSYSDYVECDDTEFKVTVLKQFLDEYIQENNITNLNTIRHLKVKYRIFLEQHLYQEFQSQNEIN